MGDQVETNQDHGIAYLLDEDSVPCDAGTDIELIRRVLGLELGDLGAGEALVDVGLEILGHLLHREEEGMVSVFPSHCGGWL